MDFPFSVTTLDDVIVLRIGGYLERRGIKQLREILLEKYAATETPIIVNFSNGEPNSLLVAVFFEILDIRNKDLKKIAFTNLDDPVRRALEATGILSFCAVYANEAEARGMLR